MTNFNPEMVAKARAAKSADELLALAKENGMEMTEEQAAAYYAHLHPTSGEIADDELENVAGGGCQSTYNFRNGERIFCPNHKCPKCGGQYGIYTYGASTWSFSWRVICETCRSQTIVGGGNGIGPDGESYCGLTEEEADLRLV